MNLRQRLERDPGCRPMIEVAARLGYPPALEALGVPAPEDPLRGLSPEFLARVAIGAVNAIRPLVAGLRGGQRAMLGLEEALVLANSSRLRGSAEEDASGDPSPRNLALIAMDNAHDTLQIALATLRDPPQSRLEAVLDGRREDEDPLPYARRAFEASVYALGLSHADHAAESLRAHVERELLPWLQEEEAGSGFGPPTFVHLGPPPARPAQLLEAARQVEQHVFGDVIPCLLEDTDPVRTRLEHQRLERIQALNRGQLGPHSDGLYEALRDWRDTQQRAAWCPQVRTAYEIDPAVAPNASRRGGPPWLVQQEAWPRCGCGSPLRFLVQLCLEDLPSPMVAGEGLLQVFACVACLGSDPSARLARLVRLDVPGELGVGEVFPARGIDGWNELGDAPDPGDHHELGLTYEIIDAETVSVRCSPLGLDVRHVPRRDWDPERVSASIPADKLGGWPRWGQRGDWPSCPECEQRMRFVIQLASSREWGDVFGPDGFGHVFQCEEHPKRLSFSCQAARAPTDP